VAGKVDRLVAAKVLLGMAKPGSKAQELDTEALVQVSAGTGWGRRRRGASWEAKGATPKQVKVVVKDRRFRDTSHSDAVSESKSKADKAIEIAREKGAKATATAEHEARAAQKEAAGKKEFEMAEKRKHEVTHKREKQKETSMKESIESETKKATESKQKADELARAVKHARDTAESEHKKEQEQKRNLQSKLETERRLSISSAKEKGGKKTKEHIDKKMAEVSAKFAEETQQKVMQEKGMKHAHALGAQKVKEVAKKKAAELARQAATEARNKDSEEKALKKHDEQTSKSNHQKMARAKLELAQKAESENREKKKRESALKVAAKRRLDEESSAKADKRSAMHNAAELANKNAKESEAKLEGEANNKIKDEVAHKKDRELREKAARESVAKKEKEIVRKTTREHDDKTTQEKSTKEFSKQQHDEKKTKSDERIEKILGGLKAFTERHMKLKGKWNAESKRLARIDANEKRLKRQSKDASTKAKELAAKIDGRHHGHGNCDLAHNIETLKQKGLLTGNEGHCQVSCHLKPSDIAIRAECALAGDSARSDDCNAALYNRMQSLSTSLIAEFDAFKACGLKGPAQHSEMMLGEGNSDHVVTVVPKSTKGGVGVGSYMYALKDFTDVAGTVSVSKAMDMMMKCDHDTKPRPKKSRDEFGDELGDAYDPSKSAGFASSDNDCAVKTIVRTVESIVPDSSDHACQFSCETSNVDVNAFTSECSGSGNGLCFLNKAEIYQQEVAATFLTWKTKCTAAADDSDVAGSSP